MRTRRCGRRHARDYDLRLYLPRAVDSLSIRGLNDVEISPLRAALRGAYEQTGLKRKCIQAFARAGDNAGGAQSMMNVIRWRLVRAVRTAAQDVELRENHGALGGLACCS